MSFFKKNFPQFLYGRQYNVPVTIALIIKAQPFYQKLAGDEIRNRGGIKVISPGDHSAGIY